jgi:hypothetical protein
MLRTGPDQPFDEHGWVAIRVGEARIMHGIILPLRGR